MLQEFYEIWYTDMDNERVMCFSSKLPDTNTNLMPTDNSIANVMHCINILLWVYLFIFYG